MRTNCKTAFYVRTSITVPLECKSNKVLLVRVCRKKVEKQSTACIGLGAVQEQIYVGQAGEAKASNAFCAISNGWVIDLLHIKKCL